MYTKSDRIIRNQTELSNYISNIDIYNSKLLYQLSDPNLERVSYEIVVSEYRPDLIAKEFYGSTDYTPYVLLSSGLKLEHLKKGAVISLIPKDVLDNIIKSI